MLQFTCARTTPRARRQRKPRQDSDESVGSITGISEIDEDLHGEDLVSTVKRKLPHTVLTSIAKKRVTSKLARAFRRQYIGRPLFRCSRPGCKEVIMVPISHRALVKEAKKVPFTPSYLPRYCERHYTPTVPMGPGDVEYLWEKLTLQNVLCTTDHPCNCLFGVHMPGCHNHHPTRSHWCDFCGRQRLHYRNSEDPTDYWKAYLFNADKLYDPLGKTRIPSSVSLEDYVYECYRRNKPIPHLWHFFKSPFPFPMKPTRRNDLVRLLTCGWGTLAGLFLSRAVFIGVQMTKHAYNKMHSFSRRHRIIRRFIAPTLTFFSKVASSICKAKRLGPLSFPNPFYRNPLATTRRRRKHRLQTGVPKRAAS